MNELFHSSFIKLGESLKMEILLFWLCYTLIAFNNYNNIHSMAFTQSLLHEFRFEE